MKSDLTWFIIQPVLPMPFDIIAFARHSCEVKPITPAECSGTRFIHPLATETTNKGECNRQNENLFPNKLIKSIAYGIFFS